MPYTPNMELPICNVVKVDRSYLSPSRPFVTIEVAPHNYDQDKAVTNTFVKRNHCHWDSIY